MEREKEGNVEERDDMEEGDLEDDWTSNEADEKNLRVPPAVEFDAVASNTAAGPAALGLAPQPDLGSEWLKVAAVHLAPGREPISTAINEAPAAGNDVDNKVDLFGTKEELKATGYFPVFFLVYCVGSWLLSVLFFRHRTHLADLMCTYQFDEVLPSYFLDGVVSRLVMDSLTGRKLFSPTSATSPQAFGPMAPPVNKNLVNLTNLSATKAERKMA
ncbi:hypothetical protein VPH35_050369 [Triticum aestivum]|uniref:Uncharacterized protein n=1 Tax=Triticum aestivum TaxID=4565 RepID=A0A077RTK9_WHEAT|nr:unnamed protein product [Triticum aestivum]